MEKASILIVDDDESTRSILPLVFGKQGYETETAGTGREAIAKARGGFFNLALVDIQLPDMEGVGLLAPLTEMQPDMGVIMVTAYASLETAVRALNEGATAYITKPLNMDEVLATVGAALEKQRLVVENRRLYQAAQRELAERKRAEEALRLYAGRLRGLRAIDRAILAARTPEEIAQVALRHVRQVVPCIRASVTIFDFEADEAIILAVHVNGETNLGTGRHVSLAEYGPVEVLRQGNIDKSDDLSTLSCVAPVKRNLLAEGVHSYIKVPLIEKGGLIGALNLGADRPGEFTEEHIEIARELADSLAVAIEDARLFRSVSEQREQLRALAARLAEMEETGRRRLARELHDRVGQSLTALNINLNIVRSQLSAESVARTEARLEDSLEQVEKMTESIRDVMAELRPAVLDDYGLPAVLRWYGERFAERAGLATRITIEELTPRLPPAVETALYRIAQEALTNVARHAEASQVTVTLEGVDGGARLAIADDGKGFDPTALRRLEKQTGWGLITMRERAAGAGGQLHVESTPGQGTRLVVEVAR